MQLLHLMYVEFRTLYGCKGNQWKTFYSKQMFMSHNWMYGAYKLVIHLWKIVNFDNKHVHVINSSFHIFQH